ncbi:choloylglycine hydrolase family protein [Leptolyngbya sp. Heron Island J]|uniref:linear amide C-N hydrolase n=1 Tax=Leptolyngbya sp. Heron Island J TaxID=1385935 RepID=UPI0003B9DB72|nr:linear amide C-N hydrolase [Leptolyngbya sp. Heron Island J]ESA37675.1 choloylglycine hydrolase family protein [Leptolyngbya sp. Heron Island J]
MCSIFSRKIDEEIIVGRNYDWIQLGGNIHFLPPIRCYGLLTHGLCLIEQFGSDRPLEGMNSQGLFMGMTGIHVDDFPSRTSNNYVLQLDEFGVIRFVLERASSTPQAVAILDQVKIIPHNIEPYVRLQYFIVDCHGETCIIAGQEKTILQKLDTSTFAAITNFPLSLRNNAICDRFTTLQRKVPHITNEQDALAVVEAVSHELTVYSCLYAITQQTVSICIERDFQTVLNFSLDHEIAQGSQFYNFGQLKLMLPECKERFKAAKQQVQRGFL